MRAKRLSLLALAVTVALGLCGPALAEELALRRVLLSTGGVGYFEYEAQVDGDAEVSLSVRLDQVDDVLKSLVVYDDTGRIGEVSLPGREPLREAFRELPFGPDALESPVALLSALRGAEVESIGDRDVAGRIIAVTPEVVQLPDQQGAAVRNRLSLMTEDGLEQAIVEDSDSIRFADPELQGQIEAALAALARHGRQDRRVLTAHLAGEGERTVRLAYVVEVPLWKTSYRLTMSGDPAEGRAALQGWAVVENLSGEDWRDVELTVVSGNPVTFRQALYAAYYVDRPEVPVEVLGRVLPPVDEGAVRLPAEIAMGAMPPAPGSAMLAAPEALRSVPMAEADGMAEPARTAPAAAQLLAAQGQEAATQVVFRFPEPISVESGNTVLVPIVSTALPAERLSVYRASVQPRHPLASVLLVNDREVGLPPGVLTLYVRGAEGGSADFVGDAQLGTLPVGEERLVSYAVDQKVTVDREEGEARTITRGSIVDGMLRLVVTDRRTTRYTVAGAAQEDRLVVVEQPRLPGWSLVTPGDGDVEATETHYRLAVEVPAGETVTLEAVLERPREETLELWQLRPDQVAYFASSAELPGDVRAAIERLSAFQADVADAEQRLQRAEAGIQRVVDEQERIRENLGAVPRESDLNRRYLAALSDQEDALARLQEDAAKAREEVEVARRALVEYARGLTI